MWCTIFDAQEEKMVRGQDRLEIRVPPAVYELPRFVRADSDANGDGTEDVSAAVYTLLFLFEGRSAPPAPSSLCYRSASGPSTSSARSAGSDCSRRWRSPTSQCRSESSSERRSATLRAA